MKWVYVIWSLPSYPPTNISFLAQQRHVISNNSINSQRHSLHTRIVQPSNVDTPVRGQVYMVPLYECRTLCWRQFQIAVSVSIAFQGGLVDDAYLNRPFSRNIWLQSPGVCVQISL